MITQDDTCLRCGKPLDHSNSRWLELNRWTGLYCDGEVPKDASQGLFEFGPACARAILRNGGIMVQIGTAARMNR